MKSWACGELSCRWLPQHLFYFGICYLAALWIVGNIRRGRPLRCTQIFCHFLSFWVVRSTSMCELLWRKAAAVLSSHRLFPEFSSLEPRGKSCSSCFPWSHCWQTSSQWPFDCPPSHKNPQTYYIYIFFFPHVTVNLFLPSSSGLVSALPRRKANTCNKYLEGIN